MPKNVVFHTHTALAVGLRELLHALEKRLLLRSPLNVFLAAGRIKMNRHSTRATREDLMKRSYAQFATGIDGASLNFSEFCH